MTRSPTVALTVVPPAESILLGPMCETDADSVPDPNRKGNLMITRVNYRDLLFGDVGQRCLDRFIAEPNELQAVACRVCGSRCEVTRNVLHVGMATTAVGARGPHDRFECPHRDASWHRRARRLVTEIEETASARLKQLLWADLEELLRSQRVPALPDREQPVVEVTNHTSTTDR